MGRLTGCAICRWVVVRVASSLSPREFAKSERHFKISVRLLSGLGAKPEARSGKLPANQTAVTTGHITSPLPRHYLLQYYKGSQHCWMRYRVNAFNVKLLYIVSRELTIRDCSNNRACLSAGQPSQIDEVQVTFVQATANIPFDMVAQHFWNNLMDCALASPARFSRSMG